MADDAVGRVSESIVVQAKKKRRNKEKTSYASIPEWLNIISDDTHAIRGQPHTKATVPLDAPTVAAEKQKQQNNCMYGGHGKN